MLPDFEASLINEIKFNKKGQATLSKRGTARLLGIHSGDLNTARMDSKLIESLNEYGFDPETFNEMGIPDTALGLIANHFAVYSKNPRMQTLKVANFFAAVGARVALQKIGGWTPEVEANNETINEASVKEMFKQLLENQTELLKWKAIKPHGLTGIEDIAEAYADKGTEGLILASDRDLYTVSEWHAKVIGGTLTKPMKHSIANRLAAMFKQLKKGAPAKKKVKSSDGKKNYWTLAYPESDFPLISVVFLQLMAEKTTIG